MKFPFEVEVDVVDLGDKGLAIAKDTSGRVYLLEGLVPGDKALIRAYKKRKGIILANSISLLSASSSRTSPFCAHFGVCGGCKWQHLQYETQLQFKQKTVIDAMQRIGHLNIGEVLPIARAESLSHYRNKLEYTFSDRRWLTSAEIQSEETPVERNALGFHRPGAFDKIVQIEACHLQDSFGDQIRNAIFAYAIQHQLTFYNLKGHSGYLRNLILRNSSLGEWMVCLIVAQDEPEALSALLDFIKNEFPQISSLQYAINKKRNDSIYDLHFVNYAGKDHIIEQLGNVRYRISAQSFFQTNPAQAKVLYDITRSFAGLSGKETVYDLYCGTGSIGLYLADAAAQVIGIEEVEAAIADAKRNKDINQIDNAHFYTGDVRFLLDQALISKHGRADVIVCDPPRAGMHDQVLFSLLEIAAPRLVYVSCNPSTQARDLAILSRDYDIVRMQPVDMFPHTAHVENVALLEKKK
jgi:23S rRNA (uracil1939-C5)-methyltransferase